LHEDKGKRPVLAALQLSINPEIARYSAIQPLTYRAAQLLLADGEPRGPLSIIEHYRLTRETRISYILR
jgi:hypothetical protein